VPHRSLDPASIARTIDLLCRRVEVRFPGSGLSRVCHELLGIAQRTAETTAWIARPILALRIAVALLVTLVLLFALQGNAIVAQPLVIAMLAVPILIQVLFNSGFAYWLNRHFGVAHCVAAPSALIGASNFFELAVATAISLFGFQSGAALATVVGVLVEVPVMLLVVKIANSSKRWYEQGRQDTAAS